MAGGRLMELIGDLATELCIRSDGDEGLFAGYTNVEFLAPLHAGDLVEVKGSITKRGNTSRAMTFEVLRYGKPRPDISDSVRDVTFGMGVAVAVMVAGDQVIRLVRRRPEALGMLPGTIAVLGAVFAAFTILFD